MSSKIQELKIQTYNTLESLRGRQARIIQAEIEATQARIIQAGGTVPDTKGANPLNLVDKRVPVGEVISWVPEML